MKSSLNLILCLLVAVIVSLLSIGCEREREPDPYYVSNNSYDRYISVEVNAYTSWPVDIYIGDAYVGYLEPGCSTTFPKSLYGEEKLRLRFVVHNPSGSKTVSLSFDNDYDNYHVNLYNDHAEYF